MSPNQQDPYQQPLPGHRSAGAWDFLNTPDPVKPPSFYQTNKKLVWIVGGLLALMLLLSIIALASSATKNKQSSGNGNLPGATTQVQTTEYNGERLSMIYPSSLKININEAKEYEDGWFIQLADDSDAPTYDISVDLSSEAPPYVEGEDAVSEMLEEGQEPSQSNTTDIVVAGYPAKKTLAEFSDENNDLYLVYTTVQIGDNYLTISGKYQKSNQDITDGFDAMVGSIKLF